MNLDYAHPIRNNTRDEIFSVPLNSLFVLNMGIYRFMMRHPEKYKEEEYPYLKEIDPNTGERQFIQLSIYSTWEFFHYLRYGEDYRNHTHDEFLEKDASVYAEIRMDWDPIQDCERTNFLGAILHLLTIGVIKKLYIYDEIAKYDKAIQALIALTFNLVLEDHPDVQLIQAESTYAFYDSYCFEDTTTFVLEENEDLHRILMELSEKNPKVLREKYFILPKLKTSNFTEESVRVSSPSYWVLNHYEDYEDLESKGLFNVGYYTLMPL